MTSDYALIKNGQVERKQATYQMYRFRELMGMVADAGFKNAVAYGYEKCEPFQLGRRICGSWWSGADSFLPWKSIRIELRKSIRIDLIQRRRRHASNLRVGVVFRGG